MARLLILVPEKEVNQKHFRHDEVIGFVGFSELFLPMKYFRSVLMRSLIYSGVFVVVRRLVLRFRGVASLLGA